MQPRLPFLPSLANSHSPAALALSRGFPWLRFEPELEAQFHAEHYQAIQPRVRIAVLLALGTVLGFAAMDRWALGDAVAQHDRVRYLLHLPIVLISLLLTSRRYFPQVYLPAISVAAPLFGIGSVLLALQATELNLALMSARLVLVVFFFYFMLGMPFRTALTSNLIVLGSFVVAALMSAMPPQSSVYIVFVMTCANIFAGAGCYALEHANRMSFLERKLLNEFATRDSLTGLMNRGAFEASMSQSWSEAARRAQGLSVVMLDIDHFKAFNDRYGHQAGDECLRQVAMAVKRAARRATDIVGRYGGEELILLLPAAEAAQAETIGVEIVAEVRSLAIAHAGSNTHEHVTVSVGVAAVYDAAAETFEAAVRRADGALYQAKATGRNRAVLAEAPPLTPSNVVRITPARR
jgi:diguanylate cyclase (GGDEF)-like protein